MTNDVLEYITVDEDSLRIDEVCEKCRAMIKVYGKGRMTEEEEVIVS